MEKIFVLRLGSLTNSNILNSVLAFTYHSTQKSVMPSILALPAYFIYTMYVYLMDMHRWGNIEQYKLGKKTTNEFVEFLQAHFIGTRDDVLDAWNASVGINAETIERDSKKIDDVVAFADEHPSTKVVIVSGTNEAHLGYIKSLCGNLFSTRNIQLATSFHHHTLDGSKLLANSLRNITKGTIFTDLTINAPSQDFKMVRFKFQEGESYKQALERVFSAHNTRSVER